MVGDDEDGGGQRRSGGTDTQRCGGRDVLRGGHLHRRRLLQLKFHHGDGRATSHVRRCQPTRAG